MLGRVVALAGFLLAASCSSSSPPVTSGAARAGDSSAPDANTGADTWVSYAADFFHTYCTSCHNAQDATGRDYALAADVAKDRNVMRCGVAAVQDTAWNCAASPVARQFPIGSGPQPSDAERARIVAWIDAGEP